MMNQPQAEILALHVAHVDRFFELEAMALRPEFLAMTEKEEEDPYSYMLQMADNVGIVSIRGAMTNASRFYNRYLGMVSYDEIRAATITALERGAESILFAIDSPGGRVSGMGDLANFISRLPVPTLTYTDSTMASAAYFVGLQADHVYADQFAEVGSVGVIVILADASEAYKKEGVKFIRLRSGDLKQAGDPRFPLSAKERAYLESRVESFAEKFYTIVSEGRGIPRPMLDSLGITDGGVYAGEEAVKVGLVDAVASFDQVVLKAMDLAQKNVDKKRNLSSNGVNQFRI